MDTVFVQFYGKTTGTPICVGLGNGFSDTYDLCKQHGDFYWCRHDKDAENAEPFPFDKGTAYVSAVFMDQLYRVYQWAIEKPEIEFIVGGPAALNCCLSGKLPDNLKLTLKTVEEWFNVPNFSYKWHLELPKELSENETIYFTYLFDSNCYWSKCIFCSYTNTQQKVPFRVRKDLNFEFKNVKHSGKKIIRFGTESILPRHIKLIPQLPEIDNFAGYRVLCRASKEEYQALLSLNDKRWKRDIRFNVGLEFPTDRMWQYMNKGYNTEDVLKFLSIVNNGLYINIMLGWNNLIPQDLIDLENFMKRMPKGNSYCSLKIFDLTAIPGTFIHDTYEIKEKKYLGPFYLGFVPKLSKEQTDLNKACEEIIKEYSPQRGYDFETYAKRES